MDRQITQYCFKVGRESRILGVTTPYCHSNLFVEFSSEGKRRFRERGFSNQLPLGLFFTITL